MNQQQYRAKRYELQLLHEKMAQVHSVPADDPVKQQNDISHLLQLKAACKPLQAAFIILCL